MPSDRDLALVRAGIEAAAKAAWRHYMDKCIELGIPPAEFEKWLAATTIRALGTVAIAATVPEREPPIRIPRPIDGWCVLFQGKVIAAFVAEEDARAYFDLGNGDAMGPTAPATVEEVSELEDDEIKHCTVCGQPVRYGERHHTCGSTVMALEKELTTLRRDAERWRPEVITFADAMEAKLRKNDHKGHWRTASLEYLRKRMTEERHELSHELAKEKPNQQRVLEEAADVANFAMMIADWVKARDAK